MTDPRYPGLDPDPRFVAEDELPERSPMALVYALIALVAFGFGVMVGMAVTRNI